MPIVNLNDVYLQVTCWLWLITRREGIWEGAAAPDGGKVKILSWLRRKKGQEGRKYVTECFSNFEAM